MITQSLLTAPVFILGEALLSYLGFGFQSEHESWGSLLAAVNRTSVMTDFWWNMTPLALVLVTLLCLNSIAARIGGKRIERVTF